ADKSLANHRENDRCKAYGTCRAIPDCPWQFPVYRQLVVRQNPQSADGGPTSTRAKPGPWRCFEKPRRAGWLFPWGSWGLLSIKTIFQPFHPLGEAFS